MLCISKTYGKRPKKTRIFKAGTMGNQIFPNSTNAISSDKASMPKAAGIATVETTFNTFRKR